mmetsp:Transcript_5946/g.14902  ORF Transcript_5946/g.14902 Transcript_5946/m.14902 type:complete len:200 (-) Transcript_5946:1021-1620(-)
MHSLSFPPAPPRPPSARRMVLCSPRATSVRSTVCTGASTHNTSRFGHAPSSARTFQHSPPKREDLTKTHRRSGQERSTAARLSSVGRASPSPRSWQFSSVRPRSLGQDANADTRLAFILHSVMEAQRRVSLHLDTAEAMSSAEISLPGLDWAPFRKTHSTGFLASTIAASRLRPVRYVFPSLESIRSKWQPSTMVSSLP